MLTLAKQHLRQSTAEADGNVGFTGICSKLKYWKSKHCDQMVLLNEKLKQTI